MNGEMLLLAINDIDDGYILSAQASLTGKTKRRGFRKAVGILIAAMLVMSLCFTTAMAVSPTFRAMVFSFLDIAKVETVPDLREQDSASAEIGIIEAEYIYCEDFASAKNGVFLVCTDEVMMNSGSHYDAYVQHNGEFLKLEERSFYYEYTAEGNTIPIAFDWVEHEGKIVLTHADSDGLFYKIGDIGHTGAALFAVALARPDGGYIFYPIVIDPDRGTVTDICENTGLLEIPELANAAISDDLTKLLAADRYGALYYVDLQSNRLYDVGALSGERADACALANDMLICWVLEGDSIEQGTLGTYRTWTIDLSTMERKDVFSDLSATAATSYDVWSETYDIYQDSPELWAVMGNGRELPPIPCEGLRFIDGFDRSRHGGEMYGGSSFAVTSDLQGNVYVLDLINGEKCVIAGFVWPQAEYPAIECIPCADGKKLLIYTYSDQGYYDEIGILDYEAKRYLRFSRENHNDLHEHAAYWFDENSVAVAAVRSDGTKEYYLYHLDSAQ